jgi:wyosine [tRNA(Phe)-imidazoG37] synthetase (radical SAM superfamily)
VQPLSVTDHNRDVVGLKYVYPVISRRAGGLSIGVNFNTNHACNWHCVYCQVPDLHRGSAPELDFKLLEQELRFFLDQVLHGDFYQRFEMPEEQRVVKDIAISGNGEPTSVEGFAKAIKLIGQIALEKGVFPGSHFVLISNGSLMHRADVQDGLAELNRFGGEVWFKLDRATMDGRRQINQSRENNETVLKHLRIAAGLCKTRIQTCLLHYDNARWDESEKLAYLSLLAQAKRRCKVDDVMLYSIARQSQQPEADLLEKISAVDMLVFAERVKDLGYQVKVTE